MIMLVEVDNEETDLKHYKDVMKVLKDNGYKCIAEDKIDNKWGFQLSINLDDKEYRIWNNYGPIKDLWIGWQHAVPIRWVNAIIKELIASWPKIDIVWILSRLSFVNKHEEIEIRRYVDSIRKESKKN